MEREFTEAKKASVKRLVELIGLIMIIVFTPYCPSDEGALPRLGMDLGYANNECMSRLNPDDWGFFIEHDLFATTSRWYRHLELAVKSHPEAGFFTTMRWPGTRGSKWSIPNFKEWGRNVRTMTWEDHMEWGRELEERCWGDFQDVTRSEELPGGNPTSGIFLLSRRVWEDVGGFKSGFKEAQIDHDFHRRVRRAGHTIYLMMGLYFYHQKGSLGFGKEVDGEKV